MANNTIRLVEWSTIEVDLPKHAREGIAASVDRWTADNSLSAPPLSFSGPEGKRLTATNFVGVVEAGGHAIEIYPKLDRSLLKGAAEITEGRQKSTMASLMWMLEVAQHDNIFEADTSGLETAPSSFLDLWAALLAKNLHRELQMGLARAYRPMEDNARTVRGRILFQEHVVQNCNRPDRIYCGWDEFTEDRPLNRILKCACRFLTNRVHNTDTQRLLFDCIAMFDEVEDIDVASALRQADRIIWDRSMQRFKLPYKLAVRLLQSIGHEAFHGGQQTYVFLLDMNQVFEDYVGAVLEQTHQVPVDQQRIIGHLFKAPSRIKQKPDFYWQKDDKAFVADSKYKPFFSWDAEDESDEGSQYFQPNDVRQLICYGLMAGAEPDQTELQIIYPCVGDPREVPQLEKTTFAGMKLKAIPIAVSRTYLAQNLIML
jgi:5-methylcytosine-specific restriction enzyme subunit McrC